MESMLTQCLHPKSRSRRIAALGLTVLLSIGSVAPAFAATTTNANAASNINAAELINAANAAKNALNTPAGHAAMLAASAAAASPALHVAVKSFWLSAWDDVWPFLMDTLKKFFAVFIIAWQVIVNQPAFVNANVNAAAHANVNTAP